MGTHGWVLAVVLKGAAITANLTTDEDCIYAPGWGPPDRKNVRLSEGAAGVRSQQRVGDRFDDGERHAIHGFGGTSSDQENQTSRKGTGVRTATGIAPEVTAPDTSVKNT